MGYGAFSDLSFFSSLILVTLCFLALGFLSVPLLGWTAAIVILAWAFGLPVWALALVAAALAVANVGPIRRVLVSANVMKVLKSVGLIPVISDTEKVAIEAGTTWVEGELFSGKPDWKKILNEPYSKLSEKEQKFIDGPCEKLCAMVDDYQTYKQGDLSPEVWDFLRKEKFLGLIIPENYGGLGFSALAHSEIVHKLTTRSIPLAISVMVPNSLGPAELIIHYGTKEQKDHYLPKLARGEEIPSFGLTEPEAGSDAGSMQSQGVVFKGEDGKLYLKINWQKRYITLGAISTVIGLAIKLSDPDNLLGKGKFPGITCVLVPASAPGVVLGRRHDPLGVPFVNCPIAGQDVVVSVDQIIGGPAGAGRGWMMLMECLAAGRSISLPAQSTGGTKKAARIIGAYAEVRKQFGMPIGSFEGVAEAMARIGGFAYLLEASRVYTAGAVDKGLKPSVVSAMVKYQSTEISRKAINDAMDVSGGSGISMGPRNLLAHSYISAPIGITVEGANILTRTMIIFGQGAIRCHPYAYKEMVALEKNDVKGFDEAFFGHVGHVVRNACRALVLSVSRGRLASSPSASMSVYYRRLDWASASFAFLADVAMGTLGGGLKFKEKITGRFADILSWMYLVTATLRRFEAEGRPKEHEAFVHYCARYGFAQMQQAFDGLYQNLDIPVIGAILRGPVALWSRLNSFGALAKDKVGMEIVHHMMTPGTVRDALTSRAVYLPKEAEDPFAALERALTLSHKSKLVNRKISTAIRSGALSKGKPHQKVAEALEKNVITAEEAEILGYANRACSEAIQVDSFPVRNLVLLAGREGQSAKPTA